MTIKKDSFDRYSIFSIDEKTLNLKKPLIYIYKNKGEKTFLLKFSSYKFDLPISSVVSAMNKKKLVILKNNVNKKLIINQQKINKNYNLKAAELSIKCEVLKNTRSINLSLEDLPDLLYSIFTQNIQVFAIGFDEENVCFYMPLQMPEGNLVQIELNINRLNNTISCDYKPLITIEAPTKGKIWNINCAYIGFTNITETPNDFITVFNTKNNIIYCVRVINQIIEEIFEL